MCIKFLISRLADQYKNGIKSLADHMGIKESTFRKKIDPHQDTHNFYAQELDLLVRTLNTDEVAKYFADQRGLMCIRKPDFTGLSDSALLDLFLDLQAKQGMWARSVSKALEDGNVSWDEFKVIENNYNEYVVAGAEAMGRISEHMAESEQSQAMRAKK